MARVHAMINRLPSLYRDGELVRGVLSSPALELEIADELALDIQRAHWFDTALQLDEAARLASLLDLEPETWQTLSEFRTWVHGLRNAMLRQGSVTVSALKGFIRDYTEGFRVAATSAVAPPVTRFSDTPSETEAAFIEFPERRRYGRATSGRGVQPLHQFVIQQRGLDETTADFLLTGIPDTPECVPVIANVTTGDALIFLGSVPPGKRLWLNTDANGDVRGELEGHDVSPKLRSVRNLVPGQPWTPAQVASPAKSIRLARGSNQMWFLPVAHYDQPALDRALLALADLMLAQGRYDETQFDHALFHQEAAVTLQMTWVERQPATVDVTLPAGTLVSRAGQLENALVERERLMYALNLSLTRLSAAGVRAEVTLQPFVEHQGQLDRLAAVMPFVQREVAPTGADRLPDAGGLFGVTEYEHSTFR